MPKTTPFHSRVAALCESQNWQSWAGYLSADTYELDHLREYYAIRSSAALIDVSPLFKYEVSGPDALHLLNRVVTRDVAACAVGRAVYTPWCDARGHVVDDGVVARLDARRYRLTAADPNLAWLEDNAVGLDVTVDDVTAAIAAVAVQGPTSRDVLRSLAGSVIDDLRYFGVTDAKLAGVPVTVSRTGYTGDLGYEVWVDADRAEETWDALVEAGGAYNLRPAGQLAMDIARIEAGLILNPVDYVPARQTLFDVQKSTPYELGLGWAVALDKGPFVGRSALRAEHARGPAWSTVGLEADWPSLEEIFAAFGMPPQLPETAWSAAVPVYDRPGRRGRHVGKATSGTWSPLLKRLIAIARVEPGSAAPGARVGLEVTAEGHRQAAAATVTTLPFFDPPRKRA
jgi:aminomethyltransferase